MAFYPSRSLLFSMPPCLRGAKGVPPTSSVQLEIHFYIDENSNWLAVALCGVEAPLLNAFDGLVVEAHSQRPRNLDLRWLSLNVDDRPYNDGSLEARLTSHFSEFRLNVIQKTRRADSMRSCADLIDRL